MEKKKNDTAALYRGFFKEDMPINYKNYGAQVDKEGHRLP